MRAFFLAACCALPFVMQAQSSPWQAEQSGTTAGLRGIHAVGNGVAWASGTGGTVLRTEDAGFEWQGCAMPPGAEKLDFRGVWAWDADTAIVMSSGPGALSRLYKTNDGCAHWTLLYTNPDQDGFFDALLFQDKRTGFVLGDPVDGRFVLLSTTDGGTTWKRSDAPGLAVQGQAKGAFAASNSSLLAGRREPLLFGTGGALLYAESRVGSVDLTAKAGTPIALREQWATQVLPLAHENEASGIFSLGYRDGGQGSALVAVGGDYAKPDAREGTAAWAADGQQWTAAVVPPGGYRSAVAWDAEAQAWIAAGPNGSDLSRDDGRTWQPIERAAADAPKGGEWNALSLPWAVGPQGRIAKLIPGALPGAPEKAPKAAPR